MVKYFYFTVLPLFNTYLFFYPAHNHAMSIEFMLIQMQTISILLFVESMLCALCSVLSVSIKLCYHLNLVFVNNHRFHRWTTNNNNQMNEISVYRKKSTENWVTQSNNQYEQYANCDCCTIFGFPKNVFLFVATAIIQIQVQFQFRNSWIKSPIIELHWTIASDICLIIFRSACFIFGSLSLIIII